MTVVLKLDRAIEYLRSTDIDEEELCLLLGRLCLHLANLGEVSTAILSVSIEDLSTCKRENDFYKLILSKYEDI